VVVSALLEVTRALDQADKARDQADAERKNVQAEQKKTKEQLDKAWVHLFTVQLLRVAAVWERDPDAGYKLLHDYNVCPIDMRDFAWGWYEGRCLRQPQRDPLKGHTWPVLSVAISLDGKTLASGGQDGAIKLWDVATRKERASLEGHAEWFTSLAFSP